MEATPEIEGIEATEPRNEKREKTKRRPNQTPLTADTHPTTANDGEDRERQESPRSAAPEQQHRQTTAQVREKQFSIRCYQADRARKAAEDQAASGPAPAKDIYDFPSDNDAEESPEILLPPTRDRFPNVAQVAPKRAAKRPPQRRKEPLIYHPEITLSSAQKRRASTTTNTTISKRVRRLDDDAASPTTAAPVVAEHLHTSQIKARYGAMAGFFHNLRSRAAEPTLTTKVPVTCPNTAVVKECLKQHLEIRKRVHKQTQAVALFKKRLEEFISGVERVLTAYRDRDAPLENE